MEPWFVEALIYTIMVSKAGAAIITVTGMLLVAIITVTMSYTVTKITTEFQREIHEKQQKVAEDETINKNEFEFRKHWNEEFSKAIIDLLAVADPYVHPPKDIYKASLPAIHRSQILLNTKLAPHERVHTEISKLSSMLMEIHKRYSKTSHAIFSKKNKYRDSDRDAILDSHKEIYKTAKHIIYRPNSMKPHHGSRIDSRY